MVVVVGDYNGDGMVMVMIVVVSRYDGSGGDYNGDVW
jgi:hypothetical protein